MLKKMSSHLVSRGLSLSAVLTLYTAATLLRGWPFNIELKIRKYHQGNRKEASGRQMLANGNRWMVDAVRKQEKKKQLTDAYHVTLSNRELFKQRHPSPLNKSIHLRGKRRCHLECSSDRFLYFFHAALPAMCSIR
jgi:hypothetical protein